MDIPKIIMQTWKDINIPSNWSKSPESIKAVMSDWKYVLMTDIQMREFVEKHFPDFLPYYDNFPYNIQRCDAFRYMWLYVNGGIYIDLDFEIKVSLGVLLDQYGYERDAYIGLSGNDNNWYTNSFLASKRKCPIWLECLEQIKIGAPWWAVGKHLTVMYSAGPGMISSVLRKTKVPFYTIASKDITPCSICELPCTKDGAYVSQLRGGSWHAWDTILYNFLFCKKRYIIVLIIIVVLIFLVLFLNKHIIVHHSIG